MYSTATSNPPLPDAPEYTALVAVVNLLQQNPMLKGTLVKLVWYDGDLDDDADADNLPKPFLRVSIAPQPSKWFAAGMHKFPVAFLCEIATEGTSCRPILAIWHAIRTSLSPMKTAPGDGTKTVLDLLQASGLATWEFTEADYGVVRPKGNGMMRYQLGGGAVVGSMLINT